MARAFLPPPTPSPIKGSSSVLRKNPSSEQANKATNTSLSSSLPTHLQPTPLQGSEGATAQAGRRVGRHRCRRSITDRATSRQELIGSSTGCCHTSMVVNNKVDSLSYDVEAPPPQGDSAGSAAAPAAAPPPAPAHHHAHAHAPVVREGAAVMELHKVSLPERRSTAKALRQRLAEVFFPDDPLHQFKNQSSARRLVLALQYFFPIFQWGSAYSPRLLRSDLVAGLTIASLAIPQARAPLLCPSPASSSSLHLSPSFNS